MVKALKIGKMTREEIWITQMALSYYQLTLEKGGRTKSARTAEKLKLRFEKLIAKTEKEGSEKESEM